MAPEAGDRRPRGLRRERRAAEATTPLSPAKAAKSRINAIACGFGEGVKADINSDTTPALGSYEGGGYERGQYRSNSEAAEKSTVIHRRTKAAGPNPNSNKHLSMRF
jgi:hypothetical protein